MSQNIFHQWFNVLYLESAKSPTVEIYLIYFTTESTYLIEENLLRNLV